MIDGFFDVLPGVEPMRNMENRFRYMIHRRWIIWQKSRTEVSRCMRIQPMSDNATYWRSGECPMKSARRDSEAIRSQMSRRASTARNRPSAAEWSMYLVLKNVKIASGCR